MKTLRLMLSLCFAASIFACASSPPPTGMLHEASAAIERAESLGAVEHAPIELRLARERLAGARLSVEERNFDRATRLADETIISCDLAIAKTAAAKAREASREQEASNQQLQADLSNGEGQ